MKLNLKAFIKGILAGSAIAFGGVVFIIISFFIKNVTNAWLKIIPSYSFSIGLLLVCYFGFFLCTGKIGFVFNDLLLKKNKESLKRNLLDLAFMIIGNIIGGIIIGIFFGLICKIKPELFSFISKISSSKIITLDSASIIKHLLYSILCGALVYLAVYIFKTFKNQIVKIIGIIIPIGTFVYFGFYHCIANIFYFAMSLQFNILMIPSFLIQIIGNFIGALIFNFILILIQKLTKKEIFFR